MKIYFILFFFVYSCGFYKPNRSGEQLYETNKIKKLKNLYVQLLGEAFKLRNPITGWLVEGCDGMLWTGKYAASRDVHGVNIYAAEYGESPGRFRRRPARCYPKHSASTWSRDMGLGLFLYALKKEDLDVLVRHANYGAENNWFMGEPFIETRVYYTPQVMGLLYGIIYYLGGDDEEGYRYLPHVYSKRLVDYQGHLQMISIHLRSSVFLSIPKVAKKRIDEHVKREPYNPYFKMIEGLYTGNMNSAIDMILSNPMTVGSYVRCEDFRKCQLAEQIFTISSILDFIEKRKVSHAIKR